ncbi:protein-L-isoaspartate(D-aspartate) O-methyltransferase-like isoform X3 [Diaphorina citri]|uniref:protein-L-isoaspartate(D-aspartate) O-methyltransferase n=1 Tax=Diaphorina citri TaxID=121845 RepID=A0A1S4E7X1_DIACI|nr:protein-L-isoaspartate(D-aspartate) O-methyltransferase-like isoform X3 [Diaphorina citri]
MIHIDRGHFCAHNDSRKYMLAARDIGYGSIIDNPVQHAEVLELLKDKLVPGAKVLDVGSGSGYLTTCFAHMVGKNGSVVGVEHIPEIVNHASNVTTLHYPKLNKRIKFICGDGRLGYPEGGPYDVIHVGASSEVVPKSLHNQLNPGGKIFLPEGNSSWFQREVLFTKFDNGSGYGREEFAHRNEIQLGDREEQLHNDYIKKLHATTADFNAYKNLDDIKIDHTFDFKK